MQETPCLGTWYMWRNRSTAGKPLETTFPAWHPTLRKRVLNVYSCPAHAIIDIIMLHAFKTNVLYYYARISAFWIGPTIDPKTGITLTKALAFNLPNVCYYLGKFPVYWALPDNRLSFPHETTTQERFVIGTKPNVPPFFDNIFEQVPRNRWSEYLPDYAIETYLAQEKALNAMAEWQKLCIADNYPPEPKPKEPYVSGYTRQPAPYVDTPISNLKQPTPEQPAGPGNVSSPFTPLFLRYWEERPFLKAEFWL